jgi:Fic family protein
MYIWQRGGWPDFRWNDRALLTPLAVAREKQGRLLGRMEHLDFDMQRQAHVETLTEDVLKSSEIEGEILNRDSVRSSVARRLGMDAGALGHSDRKTEGVVEMMLDATQHFEQPLTVERLRRWQAALFPTGLSGMKPVLTGLWRTDVGGPMQVLSGPFGRERVHFEAPPADRLDGEMTRFLDWFARRDSTEGLLRAGLAHLWFVTIHPFEDGNGRVARAIADQALAQAEGSAQRFYSMSRQIRQERADYYDTLEAAQSGPLDVTPWLSWFLGCLARAIDGAEETCAQVLRKAGFWRTHSQVAFTDRQRTVLNRYLDGFEGKLTARKWSVIGNCSLPTANRDISDLVERGILKKNPGGSKNTSYDIAN